MKISQLASLIDGVVESNEDVDITSFSGIESAKNGGLTFAMDESKLTEAEQSKSSCILTTKKIRKSSKPLIRVDNPKLAFLISYNASLSQNLSKSFIHPSAILGSSVVLGNNIWIGAYVCLDDNVVIGANTIIENGTVIKNNCVIGAQCHIYPNVVLYENSILKDNVILHSGVVVGSDGFGYVKDKDVIYKFPQLGKVIIEENVEIGANSTIDRGSLDDTIIGSGTKIDNLCHIAHNVRIGKNVIMAAQSGIAGSSTIGDNVTISGQVAVTDNIKVGKNAIIAGKSAVIKDVDDGVVVWGMPARPIQQTKRQMAVLSWLTKNFSNLSKIIKDKDL